MKDDGTPDAIGETRYQGDAVAYAGDGPHGLHWVVTQKGRSQVVKRLAQTRHWHSAVVSAPLRSPHPLGTAAPVAGATLFYPDVSNNNWNSVGEALDFLSQLKPEGFAGVVHKVSEGNYFQDPYWQTVRAWCESNDLPWLGYHYVTTDDPASQAATFVGNDGGPFAMLDFEANSGNMADFWDVVNALNAADVDISLGYCPQWYVDEIGGDLSELCPNQVALVSSAYPGGAGYACNIYASAGGNDGEGWSPYLGGVPDAWQFTDQANIAGFVVDCNAYNGADLNALFTGIIF